MSKRKKLILGGLDEVLGDVLMYGYTMAEAQKRFEERHAGESRKRARRAD